MEIEKLRHFRESAEKADINQNGKIDLGGEAKLYRLNLQKQNVFQIR